MNPSSRRRLAENSIVGPFWKLNIFGEVNGNVAPKNADLSVRSQHFLSIGGYRKLPSDLSGGEMLLNWIASAADLRIVMRV